MTLKVAHVNKSDVSGGAARAAYRIHQALGEGGIDSEMYVARALTDDPKVIGPGTKLLRGWNQIRTQLRKLPYGLFRTGSSDPHSFSYLPSLWARKLNEVEADLVHLHWLGSEMMSIKDIGRIEKPAVWTLHDMWPFCGAEHYTADFRWRDGYTSRNRPAFEAGLDLNRWVWHRKRRAWQHPIHIVAPSKWLADCARESVLLREWPVRVIPYALDTEAWQPVEKVAARRILGIPIDRPLLAFGAIGRNRDPRKGFDLLMSALERLTSDVSGLELMVFGEWRTGDVALPKFPVHHMGHFHDDVSLRLLYSAADAMVIPSRQDNLPNVGLEALACATPVIAFDTCGLPDVVVDRETGWLADAFDIDQLVEGIQWVLGDDRRLAELSKNARNYAEQNFAYQIVARQYKALYEEALASS